MIEIKDIEYKKILLVDDEENILDILEKSLLSGGFKHIYTAASGNEAIHMCKEINPDIIVLDIMLPDINGFEVCKRIREITLVPIIFLSAKNENMDKLWGLGIGGDDYITKPFSPKEVVFRIKAHFRRMEYSQKDVTTNKLISFGTITIDKNKGEVLKNGECITLTAKEYEVLIYLAKHPNYIISKKKIYEAVWNEPYMGYDNALMVHIRHLREKLEDDSGKPNYIITIKGLGYKLNDKGE